MTPRKPVNPDAITLVEAAALLGLSPEQVTRMRRDGLLSVCPGYPSYSRTEVEDCIDNPWLNGVQAATVLGVGHTRVTQLADAGLIPVHRTANGRRVYRRKQLEVVANARAVRYPRHHNGDTQLRPELDGV